MELKKLMKKGLFVSLSLSIGAVGFFATMPLEAQAINPIQTVSFPNSLQQTQSKTINIPDLVRVENISTDNGNATYSISGDNLTINVAGGTATGQQSNPTKYSKVATKTLTSTTDSFATTTLYSDTDGYSGSLAKSGSSYLVSGVYTPLESKFVTAQTVSNYNSGGYSGTLSPYLYSGSYTAYDSYYVTAQTSSYYSSGGYSGYLSAYLYSGSYTPSDSKSASASGSGTISSSFYCTSSGWDRVSSYYSPGSYSYNSGGYSGTLTVTGASAHPTFPSASTCTSGTIGSSTSKSTGGTIYYGGTVTKPASDTRTYRYQGTVVRPESDTRVYRYEGTVIKPASDTRVYGQNYAGTAYKSGFDNLYSYNVTVEVVTDIIPPAPAIYSPNTTSPTNGNITLGINYASDAVVKQYKIGEAGTWTAYTVPLTLTANTVVYARSADDAGNMSTANSFTVSNIDKVAPTIPSLSADKTTPVNTSVDVSATFPADSVKNEVRKDSGTWVVYSGSVNFTANGKLEARSTDNAGNVSAISAYNVTNIDKVAPTTPTLSADNTAPVNTDVEVSATFSSDSIKNEVRKDNGTWEIYSGAITFTANGKLEARSTDNAGNVSVVGTYNVSNIDKTAPVNATLTASTTAPTNENVSVTISYPVDASVKQYKVGTAGTWTAYTVPVVVSSNNTVYARSYDEVGNLSSEASLAVTNIDKVPPTTPTLSADKTTHVNTDVKVSVTFPSDSIKNEVRKDNGEWVVYSSAVNFTANGKLEARSTDNAGNVSGVGSYYVTNIDKTAPTQPTITSVENQNTISVSGIADAYAGVKETRVRLNGGAWTVYTSTLSLPDGQYTVDVVVEDKAGNVSAVKTSSFDLYESRLSDALESVVNAEKTRHQDDVDNARALVVKMPVSPEKTALTNRLDEVQRQVDAKIAIDKAVESDSLIDFKDAQAKNDRVTNETIKSILQNELDTQKAYLDRLVEAEKLVTTAETVKTQASVDSARDYVKTVELDEQNPLNERLDDVQAIINARNAIELASKTRNPVDVQDALDKIELLDQTNPVVVVIMDEMTNDFETADILSLVSKERYDILLTRYEMSKVAYNSLVQSYYAIKYTGDSMYKMADEKFQLVPSTDTYFDLVKSQYENLNIDYTEFVEERTASDAELRANSSVSSLEKSYSVSLATSTQALILLVEDATVQQDLQSRYDQAKAKYELSLLDKAVKSATFAVENAEKYKYSTYVDMAQERVTALPDSDAKSTLQVRLDALKAPVVDQDKAVAKAKTDIAFATKYRYEYYFKRAQTSIDLVTDDLVRAELQAQLDALK